MQCGDAPRPRSEVAVAQSRSSLLLLLVLLPPLLSAIAGCASSEEITRKIAHGYPEGRFPEHLICFGNEIPLTRK